MEKEMVEQIVTKLAPYLPDSVLAEALGLSRHKVRWIRKKLGIIKLALPPKRVNEHELVEKVRRMIEERGGRYRYAELSRALGLGYITLKKLILKYNLPTPPSTMPRTMTHGLFKDIISDDELVKALSAISRMYVGTPLPMKEAVAVEKALKLLEHLLRIRNLKKTQEVLGG